MHPTVKLVRTKAKFSLDLYCLTLRLSVQIMSNLYFTRINKPHLYTNVEYLPREMQNQPKLENPNPVQSSKTRTTLSDVVFLSRDSWRYTAAHKGCHLLANLKTLRNYGILKIMKKIQHRCCVRIFKTFYLNHFFLNIQKKKFNNYKFIY